MELLERDAPVAVLAGLAAEGARGSGRLVFVGGEAGIGKSSLVRAFEAAVPPGTAVRTGWCDSLGAPRVLGPLHDIARAEGGRLADLLREGADRHAIFTAVVDLLAARPSVTVVEDAHWADE